MDGSKPLLHGELTGTPLDLVTRRLLFTVPLGPETIQWLNTVIYKDACFWINYWSFTHTFFGLFWGIAMHFYPSTFTLLNYIIVHTIFEIWELWAGGYLNGGRQLTIQEILDGLVDTAFGVAGVYLGYYIAGGSKSA